MNMFTVANASPATKFMILEVFYIIWVFTHKFSGRVTCLSTLKGHLQKCAEKKKSLPIIQFANFIPKNTAVNQKDLDKMKLLQAKYVAGTLSSFFSVENEHFLNIIQ